MASAERKRLLADYFAATGNEIFIDEMMLNLAGFSARQVGYFPRPSLWINHAKKSPMAARVIWRSSFAAWLLGGAIVYFLLDFIKSLQSRRHGNKSISLKPGLYAGVLVGCSSRAYQVIDPEHFGSLTHHWLACPWAENCSTASDHNSISLVDFLSKKEMFAALKCAIQAAYVMAARRKKARWLLQSYTAFRWFMLRQAIDRISGSIVTAEHFDRWAVLLDRSARESNRSKRSSKQIVIVQHGTLVGVDSGYQKPMPTRLSNVSELYSYGEEEERLFRRIVLTENTNCADLVTHYFQPTIALTGSLVSLKSRVLFVGHPLCESFHVEVFKALTNRLNLECFYKPHPAAPMSKSMAKVGWKVIGDPRVFPKVELLISYPSTVVTEYKGMQIPACIHPIDLCSDQSGEFLDYVENTLKSL